MQPQPQPLVPTRQPWSVTNEQYKIHTVNTIYNAGSSNMAPAGILSSFLAAIQASLSVLLVIFYGGIAAHLK
jgi:hypothetical protein